MIWLELRKSNRTFNNGWNFTQSVFAPTRKDDGAKWPFWYLINDVQKNDIIVHLKHINGSIEFTGYSYAANDAQTTSSNPTNDPHEWDFTDSFYKVELENYHEFNPHIALSEFFESHNQELRDYFAVNKPRKNNKKRLFYVIQNSVLQCLNGAYFSEFDEVLIDLLTLQIENNQNLNQQDVITGESLTKMRTRIGHKQFAENVKRNFNYQCCYPNCEIHGSGYLVSGHITRWADNVGLRGNTQNGLCLCLLHDKAFEKGYFTISRDFKVKIIEDNLEENDWLRIFLTQGNEMSIKPRNIDPAVEAIEGHWLRIGYNE